MKVYKEIPKSVLKDILKYKLDTSLDLETNGVNFVEKKIATLQLWVEDEGFFHDVRDKQPPHFDLFKEVCETREVNKIIQNAPFEGSFLAWHWDIWLRGIHDTKIMETIILGIENIPYQLLKGLTAEEKEERYSKKYSTSLKHIVQRRKLGTMDKSLQTAFVGVDKKGNENYYKKITGPDINYGMKDVKVLPKIKLLQLKDIKRMQLEELAALENRVVEIVYKMRVFGIRHDTDKWLELADANEKLLAKEMLKLPKGVDNWNSDDQVKKFFKEKHGITINSYDELPALKGTNKILDQFIYIREDIYKYASGYGRGWLTTEFIKKAPKEIGNTVGPDGRVHPDYTQIVNTGRFSCARPNMQQNPANHEKDPLHAHKTCFIPAKDCDFVEVDFGGQELGLMAAGSREPGLLNPMKEGKDVHSIQAVKYFPQKWAAGKLKTCTWPYQCKCPKHSDIRHKSKRVTFGMPYGLSATGLSRDINVIKFEAKKLIFTFARTLPTLNRWLEKNGNDGVDKKEIRTLPPFNRYRNLELEENWRRRNQGKNTPIQGSGADMLKKAMVNVDEWIEKQCKIVAGKITKKQFKYKIVLVVHDSVVCEVPKTKSKAFVKVLKKCAEAAAVLITKVPGLIKAEPEIKQTL
jgi:DNA polymerase I-like protein with 3'-5' exonuclease and polymerase domains